ncbi:unnamed protein product [Nezara viridula]|uniref:Doublecortin domain-containing protein n=1 Tax=Nezara viridula TaxID=85310 RepID=A0A9P0H0R9_NEZVI|nr:unnamed protein product [Nezara viridula]
MLQSGEADTPVIGRPRAVPERGFWGSRPPSPGGSESSAVMPAPPSRPKSRAGAKYDSLNYWRAKRVIFYKNGDSYYQGLEFRFRPGRDVTSLEGLLDKLSQRLDLPRGARFIFSMDGERKESLDELVDGHSYVVSSYKTFKVLF